MLHLQLDWLAGDRGVNVEFVRRYQHVFPAVPELCSDLTRSRSVKRQSPC
ncbi:hypothetical protein H6F67_15635 [Microcoleus sp. FACHB-1515]|nr:hypothetical protein [Microcoleus sp. FACHB-1515]MBD2091287.1 hypothetical protein [Microcoleus sp. FACHB-1515]